AIASCRKAIELEPDNPEHRGSLANMLLLNGDYLNGWKEYEIRWKCPSFKDLRRKFVQPLWTGFDIAGKTILLHGEQGFGDTIQFARYAAVVAGRGARVLLQCPLELMSLMKSVRGVSEVLVNNQPLPAFDVQVPLLSLPYACRTSLETVPAQVPYLTADPKLVDSW